MSSLRHACLGLSARSGENQLTNVSLAHMRAYANGESLGGESLRLSERLRGEYGG